VNGRADRWIKRMTIGCVGLLALIAGTVSYLHMHMLVVLHGQPGWVAALTPGAGVSLALTARNAHSSGIPLATSKPANSPVCP
jgi:hypothetical protein